MAAFVQSGALIDVILVLVAIEALVFAGLHRWVPGAPRLVMPHLASLWPTLLSGALLMLAVRFAVTNASPIWIAGVLAAAGLAHVVDITLRFRAAR